MNHKNDLVECRRHGLTVFYFVLANATQQVDVAISWSISVNQFFVGNGGAGRPTPSNYDESAFRLPAPRPTIIIHSLLPCCARSHIHLTNALNKLNRRNCFDNKLMNRIYSSRMQRRCLLKLPYCFLLPLLRIVTRCRLFTFYILEDHIRDFQTPIYCIRIDRKRRTRESTSVDDKFHR